MRSAGLIAGDRPIKAEQSEARPARRNRKRRPVTVVGGACDDERRETAKRLRMDGSVAASGQHKAAVLGGYAAAPIHGRKSLRLFRPNRRPPLFKSLRKLMRADPPDQAE